MEDKQQEVPTSEETVPAEPYYGEQNEDGIDLSLIRENLKLTPAQRLAKMQRAAASMSELRNAARNIRLSR